MKIKLGCDPEIFLADAAGGLISAIDRIGGSKMFPRPLEELGTGFAVQEDNVAIEFNIPPSSSKLSWIRNVERARKYLSNEVAKMGLAFSQSSAVYFPKEQLFDPRAQEFGCDPDFNAWEGGAINPKPKAEDETLRSAGGHIHIGHEFASPEDVVEFMKFMDLYAGVPSVLLDNGELRKQLYGKPGAFRYKPYGGEYRTLSNFWVFDRKLISWAWDATQQAMDAWQSKKIEINEFKSPILDAVNNNNKVLAAQLVEKFNLPMV
jgi:hypothetical protein